MVRGLIYIVDHLPFTFQAECETEEHVRDMDASVCTCVTDLCNSTHQPVLSGGVLLTGLVIAAFSHSHSHTSMSSVGL